MWRYFKVAQGVILNAKIRRAGTDAFILYVQALDANEVGERNGVLSAREGTPEFLGGPLMMPCYGWSPERIRDAFKACVREDLLAPLAGGKLKISGWKRHMRSGKPGAERTRKWRERQDDTPIGDAHCDGRVTPPCDGGNVTRERERDSELEKRSERARGDRAPPPGSASPSSDWEPVDKCLRELGIHTGYQKPRREIARRLAGLGVAPADLRAMAAEAASADEPTRLLAYWLKAADDELKTMVGEVRARVVPIAAGAAPSTQAKTLTVRVREALGAAPTDEQVMAVARAERLAEAQVREIAGLPRKAQG